MEGGGGQEDISESENFLPIFGAGEIFSPDLRAGIFFLKPPTAHFIKPWGGGDYNYKRLFSKSEILPFNNAKSHFQNI